MKDPIRLLDAPDAHESELELRLLRAGAAEQPPAAAMQRLVDELGVAGAHELSAALRPTAASKLSLLPVGLAALGIAVATVVWVANPSTPLPAASAPQAREIPAPTRQATAAPSAVDAPVPDSTLALEIARIDAVRRALASDHAKAAIAAVQDYQRDFPQGVLRQEADVLGIEAQRRAGDRRRARVLAARFLAEHPQSPHSARVRDIMNALEADAR